MIKVIKLDQLKLIKVVILPSRKELVCRKKTLSGQASSLKEINRYKFLKENFNSELVKLKI
jgi:hypothetical protein